MKTSLPSLVVSVALSCTVCALPAFAQDATVIQASFQEGLDGQERIAKSGELRMLSQRIPAAACHLATDVDPDAALGILENAVGEFDQILNALEFGDTDLNIEGPESRRKTVAKVAELRSIWGPFKNAADALVADTGSQGDLQFLISQNMDVLDKVESLVAEISTQYANPAEQVHADAFLISIAGRQQMLTQKISKESCIVAADMGTEESIEALERSIQTFASSLEALRHGMPSAGIRRPPNSQISDGLDNVLAEWRGLEPVLEAVVSGAEVNSDTAARTFQGLNTTMATMDEVVAMYAIAAS